LGTAFSFGEGLEGKVFGFSSIISFSLTKRVPDTWWSGILIKLRIIMERDLRLLCLIYFLIFLSISDREFFFRKEHLSKE
jgi:hypothetical protein